MGSFVKLSKADLAGLMTVSSENLDSPAVIRDAIGAFVLLTIAASAKGSALVLGNVNDLKTLLRCSAKERVAITDFLIDKDFIAIAKRKTPATGRSSIVVALNPAVTNCSLGASDEQLNNSYMQWASDIYALVKDIMNNKRGWGKPDFFDRCLKFKMVRPIHSNEWERVAALKDNRKGTRNKTYDSVKETGYATVQNQLHFNFDSEIEIPKDANEEI